MNQKYTCEFRDGYSIEAITDLEHFERLQPLWDKLTEYQGSHVPFLCFEWNKIWLKHFQKDSDLLILVLFKKGQPVAIAPFVFRSERYKGIIRARTVSLIGNVHSPIRDVIFGDSNEKLRLEYFSLFLSFFRKKWRNWDVIKLDSIPLENKSFSIFKEGINSAAFMGREYFCYNDWVLDKINFASAEYIRNRPKNLRKETGKRRRRLEKTGNLRTFIEEGKNDFDFYIQIYQRVREKSWKHQESGGEFLNDYRRFARREGWLRFAVLYFDNLPISCHIRLVYFNKVYFLESVYDQDFSKFSPTTILRSDLISHVIDNEKATIIHTIKGDEPYKKDWMTNCYPRRGIDVFNVNSKGRALGLLMTKILPVIEKQRFLSSSKGKLSRFVKNQNE